MSSAHVDSAAAYIHLAPTFLREEFDATVLAYAPAPEVDWPQRTLRPAAWCQPSLCRPNVPARLIRSPWASEPLEGAVDVFHPTRFRFRHVSDVGWLSAARL